METRPSQRVPWWFVAVIILSVLPIALWPFILNHFPLRVAQDYRVLITIFPIYTVVSGYLAYRTFPQRPTVAWILIILLWLSYGALAIL